MNCVNFEAVITELARDQIADASVRDSALEHPIYCSVCANRFANEVALTAGLRALAVETSACTPSDNIEINLLTAFRNQSTAVPVVPATNVLPQQPSARQWSRWIMAAAAIILIALTSIIVIAVRAQKNQVTGVGTRSDSPQVSKAPENATDKQSPSPVNIPATGGNQKKEIAAEHRRSGKLLATNYKHHNPGPKVVQSVDENDPTSGFISLTVAAEYMPLESGQIVKVEIPRAALLAMGLPMNAQRAGENVRAELLVGQDGIARAIRFTQ